MTMTQVAVATSSTLAAEAAAEIVDLGGNAVDAAIAASLLTMNTEPGVCALAGGAMITVWPANADPVSYDGYVTVPGLGHASAAAGKYETVSMQYGGGVTTIIGAGSVAVPGSPAAVDAARRDFGRLPLATLLKPSIAATKTGYPLPEACHHYLGYSGMSIFGRDADARQALFPDGEHLLDAGERLLVPGLSDSLGQLAEDGIGALYGGDLGRAIVDHLTNRGGVMTMEDLSQYSVDRRPSHQFEVGDWTLAVSPPPSIGGSMLAAVLSGVAAGEPLAQMLRATLQYRRGNLDFSTALPDDTRALLHLAATTPTTLGKHISAATVHTSAVDSTGLACSITASAGYGSGEVAPGTGLWLNNCLGELELNRLGLRAGPAGVRLPSNMSPTTARKSDALLAIGSPGADRITSAMAQTLAALIMGNKSLHEAIAAPRLHVDAALSADDNGFFAETLSIEPGVETSGVGIERIRKFDAPSMYFGGVGAALLHTTNGTSLEAEADQRRNGMAVVHPPTPDGL
ncbi:MAG: gamma-glutamyltransferase [Woeseiaceae bacterium]